jgi:hypothetical protein
VVASNPDHLPAPELALLGLGPVGSAGAMALAVILPRMLLVAAALALAVVLPFAGVLGEIRLLSNQHAGKRGGAGCGSRVAKKRLCVEAAVVPPRSPAKAAASARLLAVLVFMKNPFLLLGQARACGVGNRAA